ncbi:MAG: hypothetical protein LBH00_01615, partial [Planctomycetaceae bacterium]|jgi:hypothetical protein|nr:hypothetical protein [Planctomycetaceae bacterium]
MTTITLTLSETLAEFVNTRSAELGFARPADYLQNLAEEEQKKKQQLHDYYAEKCLEAVRENKWTPIDTPEERNKLFDEIWHRALQRGREIRRIREQGKENI